MKNIVKVALLTAGLFTVAEAGAQKLKHTIKRDSRKVAHKTSELAMKGEAAVVDKKYEGHYGPMGETVYIDKHSKYYYVSKHGNKMYVTRMHLRTTKPM